MDNKKKKKEQVKPKYVKEVVGIFCIYIGEAFIITGCLCFIGVLQQSTEFVSARDTILLGQICCSAGALFCLIQGILSGIAKIQDKSYLDIISQGNSIEGMVEKVYLQKKIHWGNGSPYRIVCKYDYNGKTYQCESRLLWIKPKYKKGDNIKIYIKGSNNIALKV